jgi:hypothetical protein
MSAKNYKNLVGLLIVVWFSAVLSASALHLFENTSAIPAIPFLLAAVTPIILFLLWFSISSGFRQFTLALNVRSLTLLQTWRINGFIFLLLYAFGRLPAIFAFPAGLGDMAVGATAPWAARNLTTPTRRSGFILWQVLGMADLVVAVTLGATARLITPADITMSTMTMLPMSLVPTFLVPLLMILHIISIAQARRWPEVSQVRPTQEAGSVASLSA